MASIYWCGMDVHRDTVMVAVFEDDAREPLWVKRVENDLRKLRRLFARLGKDGEVRACYEASGAGYVLQRAMSEWGHGCEVVAPSLVPKRPGDRRKHDRKDAMELGRLYRADQLVTIHVPTKAQERVRDLVRCRRTLQKEVLRCRHYVLKFLSRRGLVYRESTNWTHRHHDWLRRVLKGDELATEDVVVLGEYLALLEYTSSRRDEMDRRIEELALSPAYQLAVGRMRCFKGINTTAAMVLATEICDWRRFASPGHVMSYLGLVPSEHSSGNRERRGPITKAGNSHCRHVLIQAAWCYRHRPNLGRVLKQRQQGQPPEVVAHSWKAQHRLHKLYCRLAYRKCSQVAVVAVARELAGFLWAVMQEADIEKAA